MKCQFGSFHNKGVKWIWFFKNQIAAFGTSSKQNVAEENQKVYVMRHGERVDFTFRHWIAQCFDSNQNYRREDLNMPETLPKRNLGMAGFVRDSPLTNIGVLQSKLTGEALRNAKTTIKFAYSSPSLRCVQTCHRVLEGLGLENFITIRLEPGLFECLFWYHAEPPDWLLTEEFIEAGYNVDASYVPIFTRNDLFDVQETCKNFYMRSTAVMIAILSECTAGNVLIAGHAPSLDVCTRRLVGLKPRAPNDLLKIIKTVPYCGLVALEKNQNKWEMVAPPCPPITHSDNQKFDWNMLM